MLTYQASKLPKFDKSITDYQNFLEQNHFIYVETEDPNFDWIEFSKLVTGGELILQYGKPIFYVRYEPELMKFSDARGERRLLPHTEASDYQTPPNYLALWCKKPSDCGGGMTTLAYVQGFLKTLTEEEKKKLMETRHHFGATRGVHANRTKGAIHPILSFEGKKPVLRFSCNYIKYGDYSPDPENLKPFTPEPFLGEIADRFLAYYEENHMAIRMKQYSLLLWDNKCIAHSRTTYSDPTRELQRIFLR
ncbi:MAG: TauD/TfdA family dioxygenase [Moorea sp. SIOASIH]|uniref:TauD/TfdA family dioxygenase n=1 Tax=Moorena sp. SIOASIH TaxID=2607817 RepID=UPI0013BA6A88|nr:TauD/TfdA family dioxygenase [Moorena sp. SIOASIH]NEO35234.1 TauD/TfdA family dioxygenase [Moorena sp. SIOASIH]